MANDMKSYWWGYLFFLLVLSIAAANFPTASCQEQTNQIQDNSFHNDHLNDVSDEFPNDYMPLIIPIGSGKRITVAPIITCTSLENESWNYNHHPCKLAQTILVDYDWSDKNANYTYMFEDWIDYDWNDIIVNLYATTSDGVFSDLLLTFREASWKNPFGLEIAVEGTWIEIEWNSTDYPSINSLILEEGESIYVDLLAESNKDDKAFFRFLIPPVASFSWIPPQPFVGDFVVFDASASLDMDGHIETYYWDFGDGISIDTNESTITHTFTYPKIYDVNLTIIDNDGLKHTILRKIKISVIIGGETTSVDTNLTTIWKNTTIILAVIFAAVAIFSKRRNTSKFV